MDGFYGIFYWISWDFRMSVYFFRILQDFLMDFMGFLDFMGFDGILWDLIGLSNGFRGILDFMGFYVFLWDLMGFCGIS